MMLRNSCALVASILLAACGRGLPAGGSPPPPTGANVTPIIIDGGPPIVPVGAVNVPYISVTVCLPGTTTCQTVDHVLLDTGSTGLRLLAGALPANFTLPQVNNATGGTPLWECLQFVDAYSWGSVRTADIKIANGTASNQPVQLIGDPSVLTAPTDCTNHGALASLNTVESFGANGVVGVNVFHYDCDTACTDAAKIVPAAYYSCPAGVACSGSAAALADQIQNPIYNFAADNNGLTIILPPAGTAGRLKLSGSLVLGVATQTNNQLGTAAVIGVDPVLGFFTTTYQGVVLPNSFFDTGSNALYFADATLTPCATATGYYCPPQLLSRSAVNQFGAGAASTVLFTVDNYETLNSANPAFNALPNIAGTTGNTSALATSFDWGLPFFIGRTVFVGFEGRAAEQTPGPFFAY
jgi:hypothetical protein